MQCVFGSAESENAQHFIAISPPKQRTYQFVKKVFDKRAEGKVSASVPTKLTSFCAGKWDYPL